MSETTVENKASLLDFSTDRSTVRKSAVNSVFIQLLFRLKGLITMPVMTYFLTPGELGTFNIILATSSMLVPLFSMNLTDGPAIHFVQEKSRERIVVMYNTVTNSVMLFSLGFLPLLWLVMYRFGGEYYRYLPLIVVLLYSNMLYKLATYVLAVFQKTSVLVKNTILKDGAAAILTVGAVMAGYSYAGMVVVLVLTNLVAGLLVYRYTRKELVYSCVIDRQILGGFLKTSLPLLPVFFFSWLIQSSDSYFLAYFSGTEVVGKYTIIYGLTSVILSLTMALNFFWFPVSARLWVENRERYRTAFTTVFAGFVTLLFIAVALFELNAGVIMRIMVRRAEYHDACVITGIIAFAFAMQVLITLLTAPLYSNGNTKTIFMAYFCGGLVNTALNILWIPGMGILGAALSTAVSYLVIVMLMAWMNYRMAGFAFLDRRLVPATLVFIATWGGFAWLRDSLALHQLLLVNAVSLVGVALLLWMTSLKNEEKRYLSDIYNDFKLKLGRS